MARYDLGLAAGVLACWFGAQLSEAATPKFEPLFAQDGIPSGWSVRSWSDLKHPPPPGAAWRVENGVLYGSVPRGTWLVSDREYGDFVLEFDFKLGERGNSGVGLRCPPQGDPAFEGLELQMVDPRYYGNGTNPMDAETLTASLYKAKAPKAQVFKPLEWNRYQITCKGARVRVELNGKEVLDVNLDKETRALERGLPLRDRPRRGRIAFQELTRGGGRVEIRNARIKVLDGTEPRI
jgi:hypothetical protein